MSAAMVVLAMTLGGATPEDASASVALSEENLPSEAPSVFTRDDALTIENAFNSRDPETLKSVLLSADRPAVDEIAGAVPDGTELLVHETTFIRIDRFRATVDATLSGATSSEHHVLLVWDGTTWLVSATVDR